MGVGSLCVAPIGLQLEDAMRSTREFSDPGPPGGILSNDVLHASAVISKIMPQARLKQSEQMVLPKQ